MFTVFFFNDTATTEIYTLSLHDALPISFSQVAISGPLSPSNDFTIVCAVARPDANSRRSEEHTSELRHQIISYAVFCLKKKDSTTGRMNTSFKILYRSL